MSSYDSTSNVRPSGALKRLTAAIVGACLFMGLGKVLPPMIAFVLLL